MTPVRIKSSFKAFFYSDRFTILDEPDFIKSYERGPARGCGGIVVLDDYKWTQHKEQRNAFKQFAKENNTQILPLPTGQGLLIK